MAKLTVEVFKCHINLISQRSADSSRLTPKLLVICDGCQTLNEIIDSVQLRDAKIEIPRLGVFALSSSFGVQ